MEDVEEKGVITTSPKYPHVGNDVEATLADGDGTPTVTWEWTVGGEVVGDATNTYTPVETDEARRCG